VRRKKRRIRNEMTERRVKVKATKWRMEKKEKKNR
jgi:hypothetical protein